MENALYQKPGSRFSTTQRLFFEALLSSPTLDHKVAAKQVGVPYVTASTWLKHPDVVEVLNTLMASRAQRLGIDSDQLLGRIVDCLEMAMGTQPIKRVAFNGKLNQFVQEELHETDLSAAGRFTEQLGKHFKIFGDDGGRGMTVNINMNLGLAPKDDSETKQVEEVQGHTIDHEADSPDKETPDE